MSRPLALNWCRSCGGGRNFGDQLGPLLLREYGVEVAWAAPAAARAISVGSILSKVPTRIWPGAVLGSGFIQDSYRKDLRSARVLGLRGELTLRHCRISPRQAAGIVLGDPALLLPRVWPAGDRHGDRIVVPHYVDKDLAQRYPGHRVVPITLGPKALAAEIAGASRVVTSSLHALIAADAYGVPHVLRLHDRVHGGIFKYQDYASALGETIVVGAERLSDRQRLERRADELHHQWTQFAQEVTA